MRVLPALVAIAVGAGVFAFITKALPAAISPPAPRVIRTDRVLPFPNASSQFPTKGLQMTEAEAVRLRKRIAKNPGDAEARALLMGYAQFHRDAPNARQEQDAQIVWFAANLPESPVLEGGEAMVDGISDANTYALVRRLLEEARAKRPKSVPILLNLSNLTAIYDKDVAIEALNRAVVLAPKDGHVYDELGHAYSLASRGYADARDTGMASLALDAFLKARTLGTPVSRAYIVEAAFDAKRDGVAVREANAALKDASDADEIHDAHTILGRLALRHNDVGTAKRELIASAQVEGSPVLGSFGPSMDLAKTLLQKGERRTVLDYLKATGKFWKDERQSRWTKAVASGGTPDWN